MCWVATSRQEKVCVDKETKPIDTCHAGVGGNLYWNALTMSLDKTLVILKIYDNHNLKGQNFTKCLRTDGSDKLSLLFYSSVLQLFLMFNDCRLHMSSLSAGHREGRGDCHSEAPRDRKELRCDLHAHQLATTSGVASTHSNVDLW